MTKTADVVVIGGGVVGSAIAYFLSREKLKVTLVEKGCAAGGTSGKCDGNVAVYDALPGYGCQMNKMSQDMFPAMAEELEDDIEWTRKGSVVLIENEAEMTIAQAHCREMVAYGMPYRIMNSNEVREDEPNLADDIVGGIEVACDGSLNPMALCNGLIKGARKFGADVLNFTAVTGISLSANGKVEKILTNKDDIATENVVNAAGVWSPEIGEMVGLDIPVKPRQGQLIVGERSLPVAKRKISEFGYIMAKFEKLDYRRNVTPEMEKYGVALVFEPTAALNFLIGSSRQFVGMDTACDPAVLRGMAQRAIRFFPVLKDIKIIRTYAGLRPYTPDHMPIISDTRIPGFYIATGHEGNGIGLSLITGQLMTQMICQSEPDISLEPLRFDRFNQDQQ